MGRKGFSLIEVGIAGALSSVLLIAVFEFFASQQKAYFEKTKREIAMVENNNIIIYMKTQFKRRDTSKADSIMDPAYVSRGLGFSVLAQARGLKIIGTDYTITVRTVCESLVGIDPTVREKLKDWHVEATFQSFNCLPLCNLDERPVIEVIDSRVAARKIFPADSTLALERFETPVAAAICSMPNPSPTRVAFEIAHAYVRSGAIQSTKSNLTLEASLTQDTILY